MVACCTNESDEAHPFLLLVVRPVRVYVYMCRVCVRVCASRLDRLTAGGVRNRVLDSA